MAYIYKHLRKDNKEVFYIGIGSDIDYRRANEKKSRNKYWQKFVQKYEYLIEIIEDNLTWDDAKSKEIYWIKFYGRKNLNQGTLLNLTDGGDGTLGRIVSEQTKEKMRRPITDEHKRKIGLASKGRNIGRKHTDEAKKKMSEAAKGVNIGRVKSDETRKKLSMALKGKVSPNKGKPMSEEQKKKISNTLKNNPVSYWKGKHRSEETKQKIKETFKKNKL